MKQLCTFPVQSRIHRGPCPCILRVLGPMLGGHGLIESQIEGSLPIIAFHFLGKANIAFHFFGGFAVCFFFCALHNQAMPVSTEQLLIDVGAPDGLLQLLLSEGLNTAIDVAMVDAEIVVQLQSIQMITMNNK